jgi:threonine dehydrogenase-like Zn-dependent dehydrogenase
MRAFAVTPSDGRASLVDFPEPGPLTGSQVMLRVLEVGVCGTDREIADQHYGTPPPGEEQLVIGHEALAEVLEIGPDVDGFKLGDLVVPSVRRPCLHEDCSACRGDRQDFCYTGDFTERGIKESHGFMAERIVEEQRYLTRVPHQLRDVGVLVEPLTIAEKALTQVWQIQQRLPWACSINNDGLPSQGCTALVLGAGPVGILGAMALVESGFHTFVYSREPEGGPRSQMVGSFGATYLSAESVKVEQLSDRLNGIDLVYEATGASGLAFDVLAELGVNGVFIFTGVPGRKHPFEIESGVLMRNLVLKNQVLFGTVNADAEAFRNAVGRLGRLVERWPDVVQSLISQRWPLSEAARLLDDPPPGVKHVVTLTD